MTVAPSHRLECTKQRSQWLQAGSFTIAENQLTITLLDDGTLTFTSA